MAFERILVFGYGNMAAAMVEGWLGAGMSAGALTLYNPRTKPAPKGVRLVTAIPDERFDAVMLGFKPQMLGQAAPAMRGVTRDALVLSVLAGIDLDTLERDFPDAAGWVRFVPNLAAALGKSPNALASRGLDDGQRAEVTRLAEMLGSAEWLADELLFDLVTALTASGPAFVYRFIEALGTGAAALGLEPAQAERLTVQMVEGAAALASASPHSPGDLARRVASPGGMTQRGLDVLDDRRILARTVENALRAARDRSAEMGRAARQKH